MRTRSCFQIAKKEKVEQKALTMLQEEKRADLAKELLMQYETYHKVSVWPIARCSRAWFSF